MPGGCRACEGSHPALTCAARGSCGTDVFTTTTPLTLLSCLPTSSKGRKFRARGNWPSIFLQQG
uniref:Uncharacterized protein n=1 Tax=Arundo donax TaxID=35708 RepID=A0A0A9A2H3_ARUDO